MARGKKIGDDVREKAFAMLATNNSAAYVAKKLKLKYTTVKTWEKKWLEEATKKDADAVSASDTATLEELRSKKKESFVNSAWELIDKITNLLERRINKALYNEYALEKLLDEIETLDSETLTDPQRRALCQRISMLKLENPRELAVMLGTLYDKQALATKDPTVNLGGEVACRKFEDIE